jgi:hypothetical protein
MTLMGLKRYGLVLGLVLIIALVAIMVPVSASPPPPVTVNNAVQLEATVAAATTPETIILNPGVYDVNLMTTSESITIEANTSALPVAGNPTNTFINSTGGSGIFEYTGSSGTFTIDNLTLGNGREYLGGAIYAPNGGTPVVISSVIANCSATSGGGGGAIDAQGSVIVTSSTITGCSAPSGGAIAGDGAVTVTSSTITGCSAGQGGAILGNGAVTVTSSTITGCSAGQGGAIFSMGSVTIDYSRIYGNTAPDGADIFFGSIRFLTAPDDWWGTNSPAFTTLIEGPVSNPTTWLVLGGVAAPSSITVVQTSPVQANISCLWTGSTTTCPASGSAPDGTPVGFTITTGSGSLSIHQGNLSAGSNATVFYPAATGPETVSATVDDQTIPVNILVTAAPLVSIGAITVTPQIGNTLAGGALNPAGATVAWQWNESTTGAAGTFVPIAGATGSTYTLQNSDLGKFLEVNATGTGGYTGFANSTPVGPVTAIPITGIEPISGTPDVGQTLTNGTVIPPAATVTYQWNESVSINGPYVPISGATSETYVPETGDIGKFLEVNATGTGGYTGFANSTAVGPVTAIPITGIEPISGTPDVGQTLTNGTVIPPAATVTYQWNESVSINGPYVPISGATSETYVPETGDIGYYIEVNVTGTGSYSGFANSTAVGPVTAVPTPTPSPTTAQSSHGGSSTDYWMNSGNTGTTGYTGPAPTRAESDPAPQPVVVQQAANDPVTAAASPAFTELPLPNNTPKSGLDAVSVLGAIGLCGIIVLFRKNGN